MCLAVIHSLLIICAVLNALPCQLPTPLHENYADFMMVPPTGRVLFANAAGLIWNAFLSLVNSTDSAAGLQPGQQLSIDRGGDKPPENQARKEL